MMYTDLIIVIIMTIIFVYLVVEIDNTVRFYRLKALTNNSE